ncbi:MAG: hypothetical protein WA895_12165 [Streptosporangiaceae bacterium]
MSEDLSIPQDVATAAEVARSIGATGITLAAVDVGEVGEQVAWARSVLAASENQQA